MLKTICTLGLLFFFYSFLGWVMETGYCFVKGKKFVNRGFLVGPICPIYGLGCIFIIILLSKYIEDVIALFVMSVFICSILEYFTSYILEKIFKLRWWDYSNRKYNVNGRICLTNLGAFGLLGLLMMYIINPFIVYCISRLSNTIIYGLFFFLLVLLLVDLFVSLKIINSIVDTTASVKKDSTEEITEKAREILFKRGGLYARIVESFNFQATERLLNEMKEKIRKSALGAKEKLDLEKIKRKKEVNRIKEDIDSIKKNMKKR